MSKGQRSTTTFTLSIPGAWLSVISEHFRVDGVVAMSHRRDALSMIIRESTRLVSERRQFRDAIVQHRSSTIEVPQLLV